MKILLLSSIYPEPNEYGIPEDTSAVHYFAKEFVKLGHEVVVCHLYSNPISRIIKMSHNNKLRINYRENVKVLFFEIQIFVPHKFDAFKIQQLRAAKMFNKYLKNEGFNPDLIVAHFPSTFPWFCKYLTQNKKACCVLHNTDVVALEKEAMSRDRKLFNLLNSTFNRFGFRSKRLFDRGKFLGIGDESSPIINSGIPKELIRKRNDVAAKKIDNNRQLNLIFVGKLVEQKRIHIILKALKLSKCDCKLKIVGEGPYRCKLEELAQNLNLQDDVSFLGKIPRDIVSNEMFNSDIFIMVSKNETLGLVYFEAMGAGCITIGSKGEGIDGIIENGQNGFLVMPDDEIELAKLLDYIYHCKTTDLDSIRMAGYELASKMTDTVVAKEYLDKMLGC